MASQATAIDSSTGRTAEEWLRLDEAAHVAGVSRSTLHRAVSRGEILFTWTALGRLFLYEDVKAWAAGR